MTLSRQIFAGLALGIFTGLFFGERAAALRWVADGFVKLLSDKEARPRFFAAIGLSKLGRTGCVPAVLEMLRADDNQDRYLRHAGIMALSRCAELSTLRRLAGDASLGVRLAAVVALRRLGRPEVADFLKDKDATVVLEAARAAATE